MLNHTPTPAETPFERRRIGSVAQGPPVRHGRQGSRGASRGELENGHRNR